MPEDARRGGGDHDPGAYAWRREALASGCDALVDEAMDGVREPNLSRREQLDVLETLDMWSDLRRGFRSLEDRRGLTFESVASPGWDENGEKGELEFAQLFCYRERPAIGEEPSETPSRFVNVEPSPALGCGVPTTETYYRMLEVYRPLKASLVGSMGRHRRHDGGDQGFSLGLYSDSESSTLGSLRSTYVGTSTGVSSTTALAIVASGGAPVLLASGAKSGSWPRSRSW